MFRLVTLTAVAAASLGVAANALAKTPQLLVAGATATGASAQTIVELREEKTDAAPLRATIYVPPGYTATLTQSAGTQIGTVSGSLQALQISADAIITAEGTVLTAAPSAYVSNPCVPGMHAAVWLLHVVVSGQTLDVPVYVDPTTGAETAFSSAKLVFCLSNPYAEAQPPSSRATFGGKLIDAKIMLSAGVLTNPSTAGSFLWRAAITPWTANGALPNAAGTVETQAIVTVPSALSLKAKVKTVRDTRRINGKLRATVSNSVLLSGKLLENLKGVAGARVAIFGSGKSAGSATTAGSGAFSKTLKLRKRTSFKVTATIPTRETSCRSPLPGTSGCVSATMAGYKVGSAAVSARPRTR